MLYKINVNQAILDLLSSKNILMLNSLFHRDTSIGIGSTLVFADDLELYPYTTFMAGNTLFNMGIFSITRSELGGDKNRRGVQKVNIGRFSSIGDNVRVFQRNHDMSRFTTSFYIDNLPSFYHEKKQVKEREKEKTEKMAFTSLRMNDDINPSVNIGNDVWVCSYAALKQGITIGDGACIGTGAIVTKDVPPYAVVAGVPAKVIKYRFDEKTIERMLALKWWDYDFLDFSVRSDEPIESFIETVGRQINDKKIQPYNPVPLKSEDILKIKEG